MKACPFCKQMASDDATVCPNPACGKMLPAGGGAGKSIRRPPPPGPVKLAGMPQGATTPVKPTAPAAAAPVSEKVETIRPAPVAQAAQATPGAGKVKRPSPPGRVVIHADSEQQRYLESLRQQAHHGRWRSCWLASASPAVVLASIAAWLLYYSATVLSYARLSPEIRLDRNPRDPERMTLVYRPLNDGIVGFRRAESGRETELLDRVVFDPQEPEQRFQWHWSGVRPGAELTVTYREGWSLSTRVLSVPPAPPSPPLGDAVLVGEVVNATNNQPVAAAEVWIVGTPLRARTGPDGRFRLAAAPAGPVPIEVSAKDFSTEQLEEDLVLVSGKETPLRVVLSPGMKSGQIRLVLTWGLEPADLDAHLEGPLPDAKRFHIYFQQKGDLKSREFVKLDVDAKEGKGPETITVLGVLPGTYHYFVHDYTNRDVHRSTALARSGAELRVYQGGQTYRFWANNESAGTIWNVCDIEVASSGTALVKKIDTYETRTIAAEVDLVFLLDVSPNTPDYLRQRTASCLEEAKRHHAAGLDCRFGFVPFGDASGTAAPATVPLTDKLDEFQRRLASTAAPGIPPAATCAAALQQALKMEFRPGAAVQFILMTVPPCRHREELAAVAKLVQARSVKTTVYADPGERDAYRPLYEDGGLFRSVGETPAATGTTANSGAVDAAVVAGDNAAVDVKSGELGGGMRLGGLYRSRVQHDEHSVALLGGSKDSETGVAAGLDWLARHQADDGHWGPDCLTTEPGSKCEQEHPCDAPGMSFPIAQTGLAILAFQAGGHYDFNERKYSDHVKKGLDWLVKHQHADGALVTAQVSAVGRALARGRTPRPPPSLRFAPTQYLGSFMYEHGIATFAIGEACAVARAEGKTPDSHYLIAAKKAEKFIELQQHNDGGWRYTTNKSEASDTSVSGWQVLALKTAREAKFEVAPRTLAGAAQFFEQLADPSTGQTRYQARHLSVETPDAMTGVGMLVQEFLLKTPHSPLVNRAAEYLAGTAANNANSQNYYLLYNCTLAMFQAGGEPWQRWNSIVRDAVLGLQIHDGCARGSWNPGSDMCAPTGGRVCSTAWAVLTLEVYYRFAREDDALQKSTAPGAKADRPPQSGRRGG